MTLDQLELYSVQLVPSTAPVLGVVSASAAPMLTHTAFVMASPP